MPGGLEKLRFDGVCACASPAAPAIAAMVTAAAMTSRWFAERRALVMGLAGAGSSAGQLLFLPLAAHLELSHGWRWSFAGMGLILIGLVLPVVA